MRHRATPLSRLLLWSFFLAATRAFAAPAAAPITVKVDASEAPRRVFHAQLVFPVEPGPVTLYYPKWLPGNHRPTGPIANLVGVHMSAGGQPVPWRRDDTDVYAFHCQVPAGARTLEVALDYVTPSRGPGRFDPAATDQLMILNWNLVVLYPQGKPAADHLYQASLRLPAGWKLGTALPVQSQTGDTTQFAPVSLVTLIDSPVLAGAHYRAIPLPAPGAPPQEVDLAADSEAALDLPASLIDHYKQLMAEAAQLFGAYHYERYRFLVSLSDVGQSSGLEHHESSDNRTPERALVEDKGRKVMASLLPHEYVHSWNGKYRRPAGLATPDYQQPMKGELLWIYEGLTSYLGVVLTARSGLYTPEQFRDELASTASRMSHRAGREWRSLADTAVSAQILYEAPGEWSSLRRGGDFYPESILLWLEADVAIRRQTQGRRSLDDFCRAFFGAPGGPAAVKTYTLDDVVAALNQVAPRDWAAFFRERVYEVTPRLSLNGIEQGGWKLVYSDKPNELDQAAEGLFHHMDLTHSLGMVLGKGGDGGTAIGDVIPGMPAAQAGLAPGMTLIAVNGKKYTPEVLGDALKGQSSVQLLIENVGYYKTYTLNYKDASRSPHLMRDVATPDALSEIIKARSAPAKR
ncbi:MAG TPA: M61 family peptidase [Polyangia bacterium]|jgi:predicted metalloprotease with PDZ domain|nr:M61 family peptidase [Polyangia bacterium]